MKKTREFSEDNSVNKDVFIEKILKVLVVLYCLYKFGYVIGVFLANTGL